MSRIFITGASGGLGRDAAEALAHSGHDVVVHARTADRLPAPPPGADWAGSLVADLSDLGQVMDLATQANETGPFDAVIHNAGVLQPPDAVLVNVVAPYVLTAAMDRPKRLIYLSSSMHRGGTTDLGGLRSGRATYSDSKLWITAFAMALAREWTGTAVHAVDPGWVPTRMGGAGAPDDLVAGHQTQVWLATSNDIDPATGGYWHHRRTQQPAAAAQDPSFQADLLAALEGHTGIRLE